MVSSEAESEGSVLSEVRHEGDVNPVNSDSSFAEHTNTQHERAMPPIADWRAVGSTVSSFMSSRGMFIRNIISLPTISYIKKTGSIQYND